VRRSRFLQCVATMLALLGRFDDAEVAEVTQRALTGLV
jgi:hypothetical protein